MNINGIDIHYKPEIQQDGHLIYNIDINDAKYYYDPDDGELNHPMTKTMLCEKALYNPDGSIMLTTLPSTMRFMKDDKPYDQVYTIKPNCSIGDFLYIIRDHMIDIEKHTLYNGNKKALDLYFAGMTNICGNIFKINWETPGNNMLNSIGGIQGLLAMLGGGGVPIQ